MSVNEVDVNGLMDEVRLYMHKKENLDKIQEAYDFAVEKHGGQYRRSGEPYVTHTIQVAYTLAQLRTGPSVVISGLLHDVIEDSEVSYEELAEKFGEDVAIIVEAVTKVGALKFKDEKEYLASNHRKIFIAMAKDVRVILVKLADRLHNMRTLEYMPEAKQKKIAAETLDVYAPIAHRLGISEIKNELEDLSFFYLNRKEYYDIARMVEARKSERDEQVTNMIEEISDMLTEHHISYRIFGRSKHLYSIYKKMQTKNKRFDEILDLLAIRVVTDSDTACYEILGHIHAKYRPIPGRFKDYIAMPKVNMYQSLHTTIVGDDGHIFEIQIRTEDMNDVAELGIAAHWKYKEGGANREMPQDEIENQLHWFKDFSVMSDDVNDDAIEYMNLLQRDIFEANVYTMTPNGRVIALPNGATPIDFAYRVHTEIGNSMIGATVNGILVPLNTELKTGDVVSIRTSKQSTGPSEDWLKFVKSAHARNKIRSFFQKQEVERKSSDIKLGEEMLREELAKRELDVNHYMESKRINSILGPMNFSSYNDLMYAIGTKGVTLQSVVERLAKHKVSTPKDSEEIADMVNRNEQNRRRTVSQSGVEVAGIDSIKVELAPCCAPIPGDEIVGFVTKGSGVKVHRKDCPNVADGQRLIDVEWEEDADEKTFETNITIVSNDRSFLLSDIVNTAAQYKVGLKHVDSVVIQEQLTVLTKLTVIVKNTEHLKALVANLMKIDSVREVQRTIR